MKREKRWTILGLAIMAAIILLIILTPAKNPIIETTWQGHPCLGQISDDGKWFTFMERNGQIIASLPGGEAVYLH